MKLTMDKLDATYKLCASAGRLKEKYRDIELIKSLKVVAQKGLEFINRRSADIPKDSTDWTLQASGTGARLGIPRNSPAEEKLNQLQRAIAEIRRLGVI